MKEKFSYFLDKINISLLNKDNSPFDFIEIVLDYLNNFKIINKGIYLKSFSNSLFIHSSNIENIPFKLTPSNELIKFTENICSNVFLLKKESFNLYFLGTNITNSNSIIVADKIIDDIDFLKTATVFLQLFYELRVEKINNLQYKNIFQLGRQKHFIKCENNEKKKEINLIEERDFKDKDIYKLESIYISKKEKIYFLDKIKSHKYINNDIKNIENLLEILNLIKKYSNNLEKELGIDSVYHTEISTISRLTEKIFENL